MFFRQAYRDTVTYWEPGERNMHGGHSFLPPRQLKAKWEERSSIVKSVDGREVTSHARVFLLEDVKKEGYLMLGVSNAPTPPSEASEIIDFARIRRLYGEGYERKAFL